MLAHLQRQHPLVAVPPERKTSPVPVIYDAVGRLVQPQAPGDDHNAGEENLEEIENGT
jgi:hypothetical protein